MHSEAAFAMIAGLCTHSGVIGRTVRHRLNRQGDRQLNWAIHVFYLQRYLALPSVLSHWTKTTRYLSVPRDTGGFESEAPTGGQNH